MAAPVNAEDDYDLQTAREMEAYSVVEPARKGEEWRAALEHTRPRPVASPAS